MLFPSQKPSSSIRIRFQNFLRHRLVSGAPRPKKNPGSAPVELGKLGGPETKVIKILTCLYCVRTHHIIF